MYNFLTMIFLVIAVVLSAIILMQAGKGHGLAGIFGGDNMQSMLGPKAADVLEKVTWGITAVFFLFTLVLSLMVSQDKGSVLDKVPLSTPKPPVQKAKPLSTGTVTPSTDSVKKDIQTTADKVTKNSASTAEKAVKDINKSVGNAEKTVKAVPVKTDSPPVSGE